MFHKKISVFIPEAIKITFSCKKVLEKTPQIEIKDFWSLKIIWNEKYLKIIFQKSPSFGQDVLEKISKNSLVFVKIFLKVSVFC